ncbi:MAG: phosphoribosylformylglycinamidine cyclo-ligase [Patescibacteria group bacterium]
MTRRTNNYAKRGVESGKQSVHKAVAALYKGVYPNAFCKIYQHPVLASYCRTLHADTAGSKPSLAWLVYILTGDIELATQVALDSAFMNVDDVGCIGAVDDLILNQTIGFNSHVVPAALYQRLIVRTEELCQLLRKWGIGIRFAGGETASVGNIVRTFDVGNSLYAELKHKDVIDAGNMGPGDILIGISSTGQASWETVKNSGMGSNGLTSSIHDMLRPYYRRYKEACAPQLVRKGMAFRGKHWIDDLLPSDHTFTVGQALLSATRTYMPLIKLVLEHVGRKHITGIIHCSGGGQSKIMKFGKPGNLYLIDQPFPVPPLFRDIQRDSQTSWEEMYEVFNMGWRLIFATKDKGAGAEIIQISEKSNIDADRVGKIIPLEGSGPNAVKVISAYGELDLGKEK